jgi:cation:H+ antiporter
MPTLSLASILPGSWFAPLPTLVLVLIAAAGLVAVIKGADWLVEGAAGLAKRLGMPEIIIGATIVSLGTTSPEVAVSVLAAFSGNAGLALGNAVGSIIADTGLIFGLGLILAGHLPADRFILNRQGWVQAGSAVLLAAMVYGAWFTQGDAAAITRWMGVLLVSLLVVYLVVSVRWAKIHPGGEPHLIAEADGSVHTDHQEKAKHSLAGLLMLGGAGLAVVIFAGDALVQSVTITAERIGVPDAVIASTIVALGTSLPELVTGITAIRKGHPELLVGNVIGADILNVLSVVGFSALAANLPVIEHQAGWPASHLFIVLAMPVMLVMLLLMRLYIFRAGKRGHFESWMGWPLLALYAGFIVASYVMTGAS